MTRFMYKQDCRSRVFSPIKHYDVFNLIWSIKENQNMDMRLWFHSIRADSNQTECLGRKWHLKLALDPDRVSSYSQKTLELFLRMILTKYEAFLF